MPAGTAPRNPPYLLCLSSPVFYVPSMRSLFCAALLSATVVFLTGCASTSGVGRFHTVVLDAGHGGIDRGAKGVDGSTEKKYALDTAKRVERGLRRAGYRVVMTRKGDYFITLPSRVAISNRQRGAIFVSIHYNWASRSGASGTETYYYNSRSYPLAANIQRELARFSGNRGVKRARFHVLRNNLRPSALVECGFLSNSGDARKVRSSSHRQRLADAIVRGIVRSSR
jgi:N-acetylmuramoyl-L-alanine amidase